MRRLLSDFQTLCSSLPKSDYIKIRFYYRNTPICKCENQDLKWMKKESRHKNSFTKVICITLTALIHLCFSSTIFVAINVKSSKSWWFNWSGFPVCSYICARRVIKGEGGHTEHHLIFYMNVLTNFQLCAVLVLLHVPIAILPIEEKKVWTYKTTTSVHTYEWCASRLG